MIDVRVIDGKLLSFNMLVVEEENNEKLMERICSMLKCDMNNYQRQMLLRAIEEIKIIKKITKSA
ncbi:MULTISPECIES: hypothetical protein [unclassified Clostridium]|uniref:hypothetical protein n=1 Tax=unclassified Clostridium TaxID=2614128 RepID=UPI001A2559C6|nr:MULTISPECIES: hypothetical protein [unclassified Clostridium]MBX9139073.1 hypothetical protein [Clostridium sp. K12(2020)]MBX9145856.1 hypothetical protein [Clostridium sp. K13]HAT4183830.1 hypothetical protein [Clostridium perfringens]